MTKNNLLKTYTKQHKTEYTIKGQKVEIECERRFDSETDQLVYDDFLDNHSTELAIKEYNKNYGIEGAKIKELREKFGISINTLSKVIGVAKKTLISYEKETSVPNDIYRTVLQTLIQNPKELLSFAKVNESRLTEREKGKIFDQSIFESGLDQMFVQEELSEYNGYTEPKMDKLLNMILFYTKNGVNKTKLAKLLFYSDFTHYSYQTTSITGMNYVKYPHGPVPEKYFEIIGVLEREGIITIKEELDYTQTCYKIYANENADLLVFSDDEVEVMDEVDEMFEKMNSSMISDYSHKEKAWIEPEIREEISYSYAFDLQKKAAK